jgi:hypothetical protein
MQGVMVVPGRRGIGHIRSLGQFFYKIPDARPVELDMPKMSMDDIARLKFTSPDDAVNFYKFVLHVVSMRTKVAFITGFWEKLKSTHGAVDALAKTEDGRKWVDIFVKVGSVLLTFAQPNALNNFQLIKQHMEVNVLPKTFGIGVKGRMPIYNNASGTLSYADNTVNPNASRIVDFGNLYSTTIGDDADQIEKYRKDNKFELGLDPITWTAIGMIVKWVAITAISITAAIAFTKTAGSSDFPPELLDALKNAKPSEIMDLIEKWKEMKKALDEGRGFMDNLVEVLKWGAIGAGVVVAGGTVLYFIRK